MNSRWVPLMQGTIPEVITLQASCESIGIPTYVPDMNLIQADPFMRGGNALALQLYVPEDRLDDALDFRGRLVAEQAGDPEREPRKIDPIESLGRRVRWCIMLAVTAPVGIWLGFRYLRATRGLVDKPEQHAWTVASFWLSLFLTLVYGLVYATMLLKP